ncbi:MAG: uroporphyrinogen decarboxylase/cobalamine-independent methonine synthase family protein [Armatimonadota bacterium]
MSTATTSMRQALMQLLRGDIPDRVVWTADLTYWMDGQKAVGKADPAWEQEDGYLAFHRDLGVMPYYFYPTFNAFSPVDGDGVEWLVERDGGTTTCRYRTPLGELSEVSIYAPLSCSSGIIKHYVETERDLDVLRYILERRRLAPANVEDYTARMARWGQYDGLPSIGMPRSPLSSLLVEWAGVENGTYLLMDNEDTVSEIFALIEALEAPIIDAVCALHPPLLHFPDNLSSENLTGFYDKWMAPTHRRRLERLHAAGVKVAVHLDGTVRGLLPKLAAVGFDSIEALTPYPVGDADFAEMRTLAGNDNVILWGGMPGAMFAPPYTWDDVEAHIGKLLATWGGSPFIIGVADQVPPDGDITFCRRIAEML